MEKVNAFLFSWNHKNFKIEELNALIVRLKVTGTVTDKWGIGSYTQVKIGDRAFITRVLTGKGIFASGKIIDKDFKFINWEKKSVQGVVIEFDTILNPIEDKILEIEYVEDNISTPHNWSPRPSGRMIPAIIADKLENLWDKFCLEQNVYNVNPENQINEGTSYQIIQTVYERNREARAICLRHYGYSCAVCGFNFRDKYGDLGKEFIHVHHRYQVSDGARTTNPIEDLRPVCPNCHAMLHKKNPPFTIEELKRRLNQ